MSKGLNLRLHQDEEMKKLKKEGKSIREIAKLYGVSMSTVVRKTKDIPDAGGKTVSGKHGRITETMGLFA